MSSSFLHTCTSELQGTRWVCWCINERSIWVGLSEKNVFLTLYRRIFPVLQGLRAEIIGSVEPITLVFQQQQQEISCLIVSRELSISFTAWFLFQIMIVDSTLQQ